MTSLNQINQCIARLDTWRQRRESKRLDTRALKRAIDLLCDYRNFLKDRETERYDGRHR